MPDDYTMTSETKVNSSASFSVEVIDPCELTQLEPFSVPDLFSYSYGEVLKEALPEVLDSVSEALDDGSGVTFCGKRTYTLSNYDVLSLDDEDIVFDTTKAEINMDLTVTLIVALEDYPGVEAESYEITFKVLTCKIDSLTPPVDKSVIYYIRTQEISVYFDAFVEEPECGYPLEYSFSLEDGSDLPSWIIADAENR